MAQVTLSVPCGYTRSDQPMFLERDVVRSVEFDADQCDFGEALGLDGLRWLRAGAEWHGVSDGRVVAIAEVEQ